MFILIALFTIASCSTRNKSNSAQPVYFNNTKKDFYSDIVINYRLDKKAIQDTFNNAIRDALSGDFSIPQYDVKMILSKPSDATIEISGKNILINTPIGIEVEKKTFLSTLKAKGVLEMNFITSFDIDSMWRMDTKTSLSHHRWVEKPKLSIGGIHIPIESISNLVIEKTKTQIEQSIDASVADNFSLQQKMKEISDMLASPFSLPPPLLAYIHIKPERIYLNNLRNQRFTSVGKIGVRTMNTMTSYPPPANNISVHTPPLVWSENMSDSSTIKLAAEINMMDVNTSLRENLNNRTFTAEGKTITVNNVMTNCDYEHIRVVMDVNGSINGTLSIKAKPNYDLHSNSFSLKIADIELRTKNILHKTAAWLAEGKIKRELEAQLTFPMDSYIDQAQSTIDQMVNDIKTKSDMELKVALGKSGIETFELKPGKMEAIIFSNIYLDVYIKDFRSFSKF
ncbi:MAG: DUF4403 family protein [Saprospiraceae bacterium]